ncbi:MAG: hypothetical protein KDD62_12370, partial [Bdellovibrionales bacterium]|nr:hypothetical protein [Bdellovibrionales bacterium]
MSNFQPDPVVRGTGAPLMECLPILKSGNEKISAPTVDVHLERVALEVLRDAFTTTFQSPEVTAVKRASDLQTQQFFKQHELDLQNGFAQKP